MIDSLVWWLAVQALACAALPLCLALFAPLADRGYGLSKAFGLLVFGYVVWLLGLTRVIPNGPIAYTLAIVGTAAGSLLVVRRAGGWRIGADALLDFLRRRRGLLLIEEALLLIAYGGFLLIRRHDAAISGTEKFMDFAFLNAVTRSAHFPPLDPWLAPGPGYPDPTINYYHLGYLMQGLLVKMTRVQPAVGFNLALGMLFGLTAVGAFSLCYGLARDLVAERVIRRAAASAPPPPPPPPRAGRLPAWSFRAARPYLGVGALGLFLLLVSGNLWAFLRRIDGSGMWGKDFWQGVGWNATRVLVIKRGEQDVDYTINEFPAFSFLLGDLHPHVLALPFVLLAVGLAYSWLMHPPLLYRWALAGEPLPGRAARWRRLLPGAELLPGALILGALYFLNSWDFPAYFALAQAAALAGAWWMHDEAPTDGRGRTIGVARAVGVMALCGALALGLFLPFLLTFKPPVLADKGLPIGWVTQRSFLSQFLQFWGIQLLLIAPPVAAILARGVSRQDLGLAAGGLIIFLVVADRLGSGAFAVSLAVALGAAYGAQRALRSAEAGARDDQAAARRPLAFALGAVCLGALLLAACEVVHIRDFYGGALSRMNTVFKLYYQAWLLFAVGGSVAGYWLLRALRARSADDSRRRMRWGYAALVGGLVFAGLHFPVRVVDLRTDGFRAAATLHGMAWMQRFHPEDFAAAEWLRVNGGIEREPVPVILEATGGAYSEFSRMATQTGFPTILGWDQHERLWRGAAIEGEVAQRKADVDAAYGAATFEQARPVLDKYAVDYVVVGYLEQQKYGAGGGLAKFQSAAQPNGPLERAFEQGQTAIYRVRR